MRQDYRSNDECPASVVISTMSLQRSCCLGRFGIVEADYALGQPHSTRTPAHSVWSQITLLILGVVHYPLEIIMGEDHLDGDTLSWIRFLLQDSFSVNFKWKQVSSQSYPPMEDCLGVVNKSSNSPKILLYRLPDLISLQTNHINSQSPIPYCELNTCFPTTPLWYVTIYIRQ